LNSNKLNNLTATQLDGLLQEVVRLINSSMISGVQIRVATRLQNILAAKHAEKIRQK
jgi:hypothetical protein